MDKLKEFSDLAEKFGFAQVSCFERDFNALPHPVDSYEYVEIFARPDGLILMTDSSEHVEWSTLGFHMKLNSHTSVDS